MYENYSLFIYYLLSSAPNSSTSVYVTAIWSFLCDEAYNLVSPTSLSLSAVSLKADGAEEI